MRIVETDNYGRDYPDEKFALPYHMPPETAQAVADVLNRYRVAGTDRYFTIVDNTYTLAPAFEP